MNKVTVLHMFSGDLWAGAEVMVFNLLSELKKQDINIIAVALNEGLLVKKLKHEEIETYVIPENTNSFPAIFYKILKLLKNKKIDVIHSHRYKENILSLLIAKTVGIKNIITTVHGLPENSFNENNSKVQIFKSKLNNFIINHYFSKVVTVSNEIKQSLIKINTFNPDKIYVVYNGIPGIQNCELEINPSDKLYHIGTVSRLVPVKDLELFISIAAEIIKKRGDVKFSVLGDGPLLNDLKKLVDTHKISNKFEIYPPRLDPASYYKTLDMYLNTSKHEGIPLSILEAMSAKKAVVAPLVGGIPEIIKNNYNGILLKGRKVKSFADACLKILDDNDFREKLSNNASNTIYDKFSVSTMANEYLSLYQ